MHGDSDNDCDCDVTRTHVNADSGPRAIFTDALTGAPRTDQTFPRSTHSSLGDVAAAHPTLPRTLPEDGAVSDGWARAFRLPAAIPGKPLIPGPSGIGSAVVAVAREAKVGDPVIIHSGGAEIATPFLPAVITWTDAGFSLLSRIEADRADEELDHSRAWLCFPFPESSDSRTRELLREVGAKWMSPEEMANALREADIALVELARGQRNLLEWRRAAQQVEVCLIDLDHPEKLTLCRRTFESALRPARNCSRPWDPANAIVHSGSGSPCWPLAWNTASDSELDAAAEEWAERTSSNQLFELSIGCAGGVPTRVFVDELGASMRDVASKVLRAMCDNRPAIVHCMRWRPTVKFGGQNDMSNEAAFQLLKGLCGRIPAV